MYFHPMSNMKPFLESKKIYIRAEKASGSMISLFKPMMLHVMDHMDNVEESFTMSKSSNQCYILKYPPVRPH